MGGRRLLWRGIPVLVGSTKQLLDGDARSV
jgi:hypothetical protein